MKPTWIAPAGALALTFFGGATLLAACAPRPPAAVDSPATPRAPDTPTVVVSAPPTVAPAPPAPPPSGPGTITCGTSRCRAGAELCCLDEPARCIPMPPSPPDGNADEEAFGRNKACGATHFLACDDAGDCGEGRTCCEETYDTEQLSLYQAACRPLRAGKVACARAELCSVDDPRCARKDNACADAGSIRRCARPLALRGRPACGKKPCAAGTTCVLEDGERTCAPGVFRNALLEMRAGVIECDRGRDCGEDESCYLNPQLPGHRCDFSVAGIDGLSEPALCTGVEDCAAYCRHDPNAVPNCHVDAGKHGGTCECLTRCAKDTDCDGCVRLAIVRGNIDLNAPAYCDRRKGACECRGRKP